MQAMDVERGPLSRGFEGGVKIRVRVEMAQDHAVRDPPRSRRATVPEAGVDGSRTVHADVLREIVERGRVHLAGDDLRRLRVDGDGEDEVPDAREEVDHRLPGTREPGDPRPLLEVPRGEHHCPDVEHETDAVLEMDR